MAVFELARFTVDPANSALLLDSRDALVTAMRSRYPQLRTAQLAQLDAQTWVDVWEWDDLETAKRAAAEAPQLPEAAAMFGLITEVISMEHAEIRHTG